MATLNATPTYKHVKTHEGGQAFPHLKPIQELRRSVLSCLLWEDGFYEDGKEVADRITELAAKVSPSDLAALAIEARTQQNLRHVPLLLLCALAKRGGGKVVSETIAKVIQRADELTEFLTLYWRNGKTPLSKQVKLGLAKAFKKFDAYQIAKYDRAKTIRLRDVLFLTHPKPQDEKQAATWKALVDGTLAAPDTWEVNLSGGSDKKETFERLLRENNLGYLALLRNLRGMSEVGVDRDLIEGAIKARKGAQRVLPFRYVAAARACPSLEPAIDEALAKSIEDLPKLPGKTLVLVDVSDSMNDKLSAKSDMTRMDAAAALASIINGNVTTITFSDQLVEVPPRKGMAGVDTIMRSQQHSGTRLFESVDAVNRQKDYDRIIVITDEQAFGAQGGYQRGVSGLPDPKPGAKGYMINVASNKNGVGYGKWIHIDGFSENVIRYVVESEQSSDR